MHGNFETDEEQHTKETRVPVGLAPGRDTVYDYEFMNARSKQSVMLSAPLEGQASLEINGAEDEGSGLGGGDT